MRAASPPLGLWPERWSSSTTTCSQSTQIHLWCIHPFHRSLTSTTAWSIYSMHYHTREVCSPLSSWVQKEIGQHTWGQSREQAL